MVVMPAKEKSTSQRSPRAGRPLDQRRFLMLDSAQALDDADLIEKVERCLMAMREPQLQEEGSSR